MQNGRLTDEDYKQLINKKPIEGQLKIDTIESKENVPETSTFEKEEDVQRTDTVEPEEKVLETSTFENSNMAAERLYTINDIELEMETYRFRYERAIKSDIALKYIMKQRMLYDALTLLLDSIKKGESR